MSAQRLVPANTYPGPTSLPRGRTLDVRSADGTRLHTQVFGPADGYPVVLSHGITCALRVWHEQIRDLSRDYRVIAFDHRGHGRSDVPRRGRYSLNHLAADLDAVLSTALRPGERAVVAGHSMGGIAITAWAERYRHRVAQRLDAAALINTTTGELLEEVQLYRMPARLSAARVAAAGRMLKTFGSIPVLPRTEAPTRRFVSALAVGRDADPAIAQFVYELYATTPPAGRGGCARALVDGLGPRRRIGVRNLTVPTLVIGSERDRLLPVGQSRKIAAELPDLFEFVTLPGGHCAILERPDEVNRRLRALIENAGGAARLSS
ncbi:alpha/beta hydrolase [Mycobacterium sp. MYCO198283]|uniref:alpha/beta fold hydrolase n=1 Tax=Mycobacterium sp. MYCO198283 TaxID=2883505 RepID=UPI001E32D68C|nr:alpha/beta hydrolase [Mycobacterium sp. MYCO198283]MCG5431535.1 alpha/beta hydrolase [Mycobacterium sp. MYCO198283]